MTNDLKSLINTKSWREVLNRCKEKPQEVTKSGEFSIMANVPALYLALCKDAPFEIIQLILSENPLEASKPSIHGELPLHAACMSTSIQYETIKIIVEAYSEATFIKNDYGRTPLHYAVWHGLPVNILYLLLSYNPSAVYIKDSIGISCFVWFEFKIFRGREIMKKAAINSLDKHSKQLVVQYFETMSLLAITGYLKSVPPLLPHVNAIIQFDCKYLFHSLLQLGPICPLYFFNSAIAIYPENLCIPNSRGELPLHIAAGYNLETGRKMKNVYYEHIKEFVSSDTKRYTYISCVISVLLKHYPNAAKVGDCKGRLPLHFCVENSAINWESIFVHYPQAVYIRDPVLGLFPFMIAAMNHNLNCSFQMLRCAPDVLKHR